MKCNRFFRILSAAVVLALLMIALPAIPVAASPMIELDIEKGQIGDRVTVDGAGFQVSVHPYYHDVHIYFCSDQLDIDDEIDYSDHYYTIMNRYVVTDEGGSFSKSFDVPDVIGDDDYASKYSQDVIGGTYYIYITYSDQTEIVASAEFTVIGVTSVEPASGPVGTEVEISGIGFDSNDTIEVEYDGGSAEIVSGDRRVKNTGTFSCSIEVPESTAGYHTITVMDDAGHTGSIQFEVIPQIALSPATASLGQEVTVTGTGFGENSEIYIYFDGDEIFINGDYYTDDRGSFESSFQVPNDILPDSYEVEVDDDYGSEGYAMLEIGAGLTVEPETTTASPGYVGMELTITGNGFTPGADVEISYETDPVVLDTVEADANGDFQATVTIPASEAGEHTITADDGTNSEQVTFIMESSAPSAPTLLVPANDEEIDGWTFEWEVVSDDSLPVTYEFQIATDDQFSDASVVLYKDTIAAAEYTLADDEELEQLDNDAPYYWRVRAVDAASNDSAWSNARTFLIGGFSMPTWLIWTLVGIGVAGLFILGIWLGRRSSLDEYYY